MNDPLPMLRMIATLSHLWLYDVITRQRLLNYWYVFGSTRILLDERRFWNSTLQWRIEKHCRKSISFSPVLFFFHPKRLPKASIHGRGQHGLQKPIYLDQQPFFFLLVWRSTIHKSGTRRFLLIFPHGLCDFFLEESTRGAFLTAFFAWIPYITFLPLKPLL